MYIATDVLTFLLFLIAIEVNITGIVTNVVKPQVDFKGIFML